MIVDRRFMGLMGVGGFAILWISILAVRLDFGRSLEGLPTEAVRAGVWTVLVVVAFTGLLWLAMGLDRLWSRRFDVSLRLELRDDSATITRVRRALRSGAEKVLERQDITRTVSVSHVNGDALDPEEGVQLHDREPAIRMGLFGEIPTVDDAELLARVGHDQLVGAFGRDLATFLRSRPLVRCEYSLDDETLWRALPGHELKHVEAGITFEGDKIVWQVPEQDRDE